MQYFKYNECKQRGTFDFPIEIYCINNQHPQYTMPYHWHIEYEIIRIIDGEFIISLNDNEWKAGKGDVIFINSGTLHGAIPLDCIYECIVFDMDMLLNKNDFCQSYISRLMNHSIMIQEYYPYNKSEKSDLHEVVKKLFEAMAHKKLGYQFTVKGCLYQLIGIILQENHFNTDTPLTSHNDKRIVQLKQALEVIENQYSSTLTLEQLSMAAGMSPKYFCRFFREMTHKSPIDYLNYYRIERSCYHLINSDQPITDIAHSCGFNDFSYFIKTFKKYKNETPKKYRSINF
jgi:AraC-like DNA-binding protein